MAGNQSSQSRFTQKELDYVEEVLRAEFRASTAGSMNQRLELAFSARHGVRYAVTHNSGTSTLHSCLAAAGVGPGDEVISPALGPVSMAYATIHQNAVPVFADVKADTFNIDPEDVRRRITPRTKAIIAVALYGLPPDLDELMELATMHGLVVIEDNAECLLAEYKGRLAGTIGHMASYSFEDSKHISTGDGGIVITDDEALARRIRLHGALGFKALAAGDGRVRLDRKSFQNPDYKRHSALGWNYRLSEILAAVALAQVERIDEIIARRQAIAQLYQEAVAGCAWLVPQRVPADRTNSYWTYAMTYEGADSPGISWTQFHQAYIDNGGDGFYAAWSPVYLEPSLVAGDFYGKGCPLRCPSYEGQAPYGPGLCPITESIQPKIVQLKTSYIDMKVAEQKAEALYRTVQQFGG